MKKKNRMILVLLIAGLIIYTFIDLYIARQYEVGTAYKLRQLDVAQNDISNLMPYKNPYMGNNTNTINLFTKLPLAGSERTFELFPNTLTTQINYEDILLRAGGANLANRGQIIEGTDEEIYQLCEDEAKKSLVYNSIAAFALIDNLECLIYRFADIQYQVNRSEIEAIYPDLNSLLEKEKWNEQVQQPLNDIDYVNNIAESILKES